MALLLKQTEVQTLNTISAAQPVSNQTLDCESFVIYCNSGSVSVGGQGVTLANGYPLVKGEKFFYEIPIAGDKSFISMTSVYWIGDSKSASIRCIYLKREST